MNPPPTYQEAVENSLSNPYQPPQGAQPVFNPQVAPQPLFFPDYVDTQAIPSGNILRREQVGLVTQSKVAIKTNGDGDIESFDGRLDHDAKELFNYFMSYMDAPKMDIQIYGTHTERRDHYRTVDGERVHEVRIETITDFNFSIDISALIYHDWSRLVCLQDGSVASEWKQVMELYTSSNNPFKEIHMTKQPIWDYQELKLALTNCIRSTGYLHRIEITFQPRSEKVSAFSSGWLSKLAHNTCCQCLLWCSCLCIIVFPLYFCMRRLISNR